MIDVRCAGLDDLDRVAPLFDAYRQFYRQPSDIVRAHQFLRERMARKESVILVAIDRDELVLGFTQLYPLFSSVRCVPTWLLNDLYVASTRRRQGIGAALLSSAAAFARSHGAATLSLSTAVDNVNAQRLYESLGWQRDREFFDYHLSLTP